MKARQRKRYLNVKQRGYRIGKRCREFMPGCIVCESWAFYDAYQRFPTFDEAYARVLAANQQETT